MSILVVQITIKQWDKSQRTAEHIQQRAAIAKLYPINVPPAVYIFNKQCLIDPHGDDLLGNRVRYSQDDNGKITFDRFQVCLKSKVLDYIGSDKTCRSIGSLDNQWIQCQYDWRYSVYEGGFYYWLYEEVCINVISVNELDENVFLKASPALVFTL
ncbi:MAG: hypothetical protein GQ582_13310 [Methyloprofundus sp.]|nr:hypothetical protein [Methyloprofundus sp.]